MRRLRRNIESLCCVALVATALGCPPKEEKTPPPPRDGVLGARRCNAEPGRKNPRVPVFDRPFDGEYPVYNLFDHVTPGIYMPYDPGNTELSYCGIDMLGLSEGYEGYGWGLPSGTPVLAVADGEVTHAGVDEKFFCPLLKKMVSDQVSVTVRHEGLGGIGYATIYRHLSRLSVKEGDKVQSGQRLGVSGDSGCATEAVFYLGVLRITGTKNGKPTSVDPYGWDGPRVDPWSTHSNGAPSVYLWKDGEAPSLGGRVK